MQFRPRIVAATGTIMAALVLFLVRRRPATQEQNSLVKTADRRPAEPALYRDGHSQGSNQRPLIFRWLFPVCLIVASCILWKGTGRVDYRHPFPQGIALLTATALLSFILRGPRVRYAVITSLFAALLLIMQFSEVASTTINGVRDSVDPTNLLELTVFGICGLGIIMSLLVTWTRGWSYAEPLAIGLVAIALGALCLPGIQLFTKSLHFPNVNGDVLLFATGSASQGLRFYASATPMSGSGSPEDFTVDNLSSHAIHWALLLVADARITQIQASPPIKQRTLVATERMRVNLSFYNGVITSVYPAQLFWGVTARTSMSTINGWSLGAFVNKTSDRSAVSLPNYEQGDLSMFAPATGKIIVDALSGKPTLRQLQDFTIKLYDGKLNAFESMTQSNPPFTPDFNDPSAVQWTSHLGISPTYATIDQNAADATTNIIFAFGVLLGVAGSGLIAGVQGVIHAAAKPSAGG
jgi:hypothetical protein